jgi:hypothetical protein
MKVQHRRITPIYRAYEMWKHMELGKFKVIRLYAKVDFAVLQVFLSSIKC